MNMKPDLNKLKTEIDNRRKNNNNGVNITTSNVMPRDAFLYELTQSLDRGTNSRVANNMKSLNERANIISNSIATGKATPEMIQKVKELKSGSSIPAVNEQIPIQPQPRPTQTRQPIDISPDREELMFADLDKKRNGTLAESLEKFSKIPQMGAPMTNEVPANYNQKTTINEGYLIENFKKFVDGYLSENLTPIFEEAIKNTIIEMYAIERIKDVLNENAKELIQPIVYDVIRDIQKKNKEKTKA